MGLNYEFLSCREEQEQSQYQHKIVHLPRDHVIHYFYVEIVLNLSIQFHL